LIEVGSKVENRAVQGTALDTLGELFMLQGKLAEAERTLERSLYHLQAANFPYGEVQAVQTLGRCFLAQGQYQRATEAFEQQLALAERVEDKRSRNSAYLYLAQTQVEMGNLVAAQALLDQVAEDVDTSSNISLVGHCRAVSGMLHQGAHDFYDGSGSLPRSRRALSPQSNAGRLRRGAACASRNAPRAKRLLALG
jgi:tetratricopeptide (TPR) repeat protein